ncbi:MAG: response regulator [Bacteroidales bacterium]|nr:response regulator [Bacteroidales bacterium]
MKKLFSFLTAALAAIVPLLAQTPEFATSLSSPQVTSFAEDSRGFIWIGTNNGLNRFNGSTYSVYHSGKGLDALDIDNILDVMEDSDGNLWLGTECGIRVLRNGVQDRSKWSEAVINPVCRILDADDSTIVAMGKNGFARFRKSDLLYVGGYNENGLPFVTAITKTIDNHIWTAFSRSDSTFVITLDNTLRLRTRHYLGRNVAVNAIRGMSDGSVMVSTDSGLRRFLGKDEISVQPDLERVVNGKKVLFTLPFRGNILFGIKDEGLFHFDGESVRKIVPQETLKSDKYTVFVDSRDYIWLSDGMDGFKVYSPHLGYETLTVSTKKETISNPVTDRDGNLWMNCGGFLRCISPADGHSLYEGDRKVYGLALDSSSGRLAVAYDMEVTVYSVSEGRLSPLGSYGSQRLISGLGFDNEGSLWFSSVSAITTVKKNGEISHPEGIENIGLLNYIESDPHSGRIFMHTISRGVYELFPDGTFSHFQHIEITDNSIQDQANMREDDIANISCLHVDKDGSIWFGTYSHGLLHYDLSTGKTEVLSEEEGLPIGNIRSITEDRNGDIWFSTTSHIYRYSRKEKTFTSFHDRNFDNGGSYDPGSVTEGTDGKLYFGGNGLLTVVDPEVEITTGGSIPIYIEYLGINGEAKSTDFDHITLSHRQNNISLRFASPVYEPGALLTYSWMLEGFDNDWNYGTQGREVIYDYIPAGKYTFKARVRQQSGEWSPEEISIPVTIKPSIWGSALARVLYLLALIGIISAIITVVTSFRTQKERAILAERREGMKQEQVDFVTNISHEFRTPLSMIFAPAKELSKMELPYEAKSMVGTILRNADRLKSLSGQILDSNSSPDKKEHLEIRHGNLAATVRAMTENFRFASLEKGLTLSISAPESLPGWFDREKIGKIVTNLLSNAIKYTPEGRSIDVIVRQEGDKALVSVSDDGIGIAEDKRDRIFERFDRLGAEEGTIPGSGIGLSYSHSLALLHKGSLTYLPKHPDGSVFTLSIPLDKASYDGEIIVRGEEEDALQDIQFLTPESDGSKNGTILVVEDSEDIRLFIRNLLAPSYRVVMAADGLEAKDSLKLGLPDLVISDIMMPGMNGYELCREIKGNSEWSHIPVVLLTAKADAASSIEGLKSGADAYIPKPFDPDYLKAAVESIIRNRRILQNRILNMTKESVKAEPEKTDEVQLSPKDKVLMEKLLDLMEKNMATESFGAEEMASALEMSYSSLYSKMKALTGKTPLFFINNYRMNRAMELLKTRLYTVSEVAYKIGSLSPNTFSRDFKKHFGVTPSSVMKEEE